ncbi:MAG: hypothetical protein ABIO70_17015 [Pseudomonadota bacterium]
MTDLSRTLQSLGASRRTPTGLLHALAAAEGAFSVVCAELAEAGLDEALLADLAEGVPWALSALLPATPPEDPDDREAWLDTLDLVDRAARALAALQGPPPPWARPLLELLQRTLTERRSALEGAGWTWAHARAAAASGGGLLAEVLNPGIPHAPSRAVFAAWEDGELHPRDEAVLRERVARPGPWQEAWRASLRQQLDGLDVERLPVPFDAVAPRLLHAIPLPHFGPDAAIEVHGLADGLRWSWPGQEPMETPWNQARVSLPGDPVTGPLRATLEVQRLGTLLAAERAVDLVADLSGEEPDAEALAVGAARALGSAFWLQQMRSLAEGFRLGQIAGEPSWAALAVRLRMVLDELCAALPSPRLFDLLDAADEAMEQVREAVLTIDADLWEDLADEAALGGDAWWGWRATLGDAVPDVILTDALLDLGREQEGLLARFAARMAELAATSSSAWASHRAAWQRLMAPRPGVAVAHTGSGLAAGEARVPILAVIEGQEAGLVLELCLRRGTHGGDLWEDAGLLREGARDAVRNAFWAVAALTSDGLPPAELDAHRLRVLPADAVLEVDGASLTLSAALAFAVLWTGIPLPPDLAASARLGGDGTAFPVGMLAAKLRALGTVATEALPLRLMVARGQPDEEPPPQVSILRVDHLRDALETAGLLAGIASLRSADRAADEEDCRDELRRLIEHARRQHIRSYGRDHTDAWLHLADRLRWLVTSMEEREIELGLPSAEARSWTVLAYNYGGEDRLAEILGRDFLPASLPHGAPRAFLLIVYLAGLIFQERWDLGEVHVPLVEGELAYLDDENLRQLKGMAFGTIGRFWMHRRAAGWAERALPRLQAAVEHHEEHLGREAPRSRTYLANALLRAGRAAEALREADAALGELSDRRVGASYAATTGMFVRYERARALFFLGRYAEAASDARLAIEAGQRLAWPQAGPLRTLAWACQRLGDSAGREEALREIHHLVGARTNGVEYRILQEALGEPLEPGEGEVF